MKKQIYIITFFLVVLVSSALSQPPPPGAWEIGQQKEDNAANHNHQTDNIKYHSENSLPSIPITDKKLTIIPGNQQYATGKTDNHNNKTPDNYCVKLSTVLSKIDWIVFFTAILAVVAIIQAFILRNQTRYFHRIERAYVFANVENNQIESVDNTDYQTITTPIFLQNHGKTPAVIVNIRAVLVLEKPQIPVIEETTFPTGLILGSDKWHRIFIDRHISKVELVNVEAWNTPLYCCGRIKYKDVFNKEHKTGFCWEYKPHKSRPLNSWVISNNKELNYYT